LPSFNLLNEHHHHHYQGGELDGVIEEVQVLVRSKHRPELEGYNFNGIEPGGNSNAFVRSELRQRIEKTSTILGVDFPVLDGKISTGGDFDDIFTDLANWVSYTKGSKSSASQSIGISLLQTKSYDSALNELRLSDCRGTFKERNQHLSKLEMRQKAAKVEDVSHIYGERTGIRVGFEEGETTASSSVSKSLMGDNIEYRSQTSRKKTASNQKRIKGDKMNAHQHSSNMGGKIELNLNPAGAKRDHDEEANAFMYKAKVKKSTLSRSRLSSPLKEGGRLSPLMSPKNSRPQSVSFVTQDLPPLSKIRTSPVKVSLGVVKTEAANRRCRKYASYKDLEKILALDTSRIQPLGPEDLQKLKVRREARKDRHLAAVIQVSVF
jgi:hypothetical protein